MKEWFHAFAEALRGKSIQDVQLIGAGDTSAEVALDHYRFQHWAKIQEVIEDTFPDLVNELGDGFKDVFENFKATGPTSPRSLDFYPDVFLAYFLMTDASIELKDLASFERALDIYSWTHLPLEPSVLSGMNEDSRLELGDYRVFAYQSGKKALIWLNHEGVQSRIMQDWELAVLQELPNGIGHALESAPENPTFVSTFFKWLGQSCLIKRCHVPF